MVESQLTEIIFCSWKVSCVISFPFSFFVFLLFRKDDRKKENPLKTNKEPEAFSVFTLSPSRLFSFLFLLACLSFHYNIKDATLYKIGTKIPNAYICI